MIKPATPLPWRATGLFYPGGIKCDIVAVGDATSLNDATAIARIVRPLSRNEARAEGKPICSIQEVGKKRRETPLMEQDTAYIVHAANTFPALVEALEAAASLMDAGLSDNAHEVIADAIALVKGEAA